MRTEKKNALVLGLTTLAAVFAACGGSTDSSSGTGGGSGTGATAGSGASAGSGGSGGGPDFFSCNDASQCELFANNCCGGYCDVVPISSFTAINSSHKTEYESLNCPTDIACPGCIGPPIPNFADVCRSGKCTAIDIRNDELSACSTEADCTLRWGSGCCEDCNPSDSAELIAVSVNANVTSELCGASLPPCCAPGPKPANAKAVCTAGHCAVQL